MPGTPALISFNTRKREAFSRESSLGASQTDLIKSRLIKLWRMELGHMQETKMFPISGFECFLVFFADKRCLVANARTSALQLLCLLLILTMPILTVICR